MKFRSGSALLAAAALATCTTPAFAATTDAQFARQAAQGGLAEVQLAQLAEQKSRNATVLAFARKMIADHTPNNAKLASIMRSEGLMVPTTVDPNSMAAMTRLQALSGAAFNSAYLSQQMHAHQQMQILMQAEANGGKDARLAAYARATLSAVNQHLNLAKSDLNMRHMANNGMGGMSGGSMSNGMSSSHSGGSGMSGGTRSMDTMQSGGGSTSSGAGTTGTPATGGTGAMGTGTGAGGGAGAGTGTGRTGQSTTNSPGGGTTGSGSMGSGSMGSGSMGGSGSSTGTGTSSGSMGGASGSTTGTNPGSMGGSSPTGTGGSMPGGTAPSSPRPAPTGK